MVMIQIDLNEEESRTVELFKVVHKLKTKQEAIKKMLDKFKPNIEWKDIK